MKKIYLFLLFFYSGFVFAFAPGFETVDSSTGGSGSVSERLLANAPYSLCELDVPYISRENCDLVSLALGGSNYSRWVLEGKNIDHPPPYFLSISVPNVDNLLANYHINPGVDWRVPTMGQLTRLINMGIVTPMNNRYYWVRSDTSPSLSRVRYRPTGGSTEPNAALERLVSQHLGSDPVTDLVPDRQYFLSLFSSIFGATTRLTINYTNVSGQAITETLVANNQQHRRYVFPLNVTNVTIRACQTNAPSVCSSTVPINFGVYAGACARTTGSTLLSTRLGVTYTTSALCSWE